MKKIALPILCILALCLCFVSVSADTQTDLYVKRVENLPEDFIFGMDASIVIAEENSGVLYYDEFRQPQDVFEVFAENGITHIRVRVWNHPYDEQGHGYGGGNCDIDTAVQIGKRATACGMKLIVDFHYSDFWADPSKQMVPLEWQGMNIEEKTQAVYDYTKECLLKLRDAGIDVGMVQMGNETNNLMCGEKTWFNIQYLMQAGARATREIYPEALVALHFTNPEKEGNLATYARKMDYYQVDYDVFATSWYPYWHGSLENLASVLNEITGTYGKKVMVMETSYAYTGGDSDFFGNTVSEGSEAGYPFTVQGQANCIRDLTDTIVNLTRNGIGIVYWEGAWITVGGDSWEENSRLWETYGSGWATSYAFRYDPKDAGKYYGGSAVDNQALFAPDGTPLESLKVFRLMRDGNETEQVTDAPETVFLLCDINGEIGLPDEVNAIMNDNSRQSVPVQWNVTEEQLQGFREAGTGTYEIAGIADGMNVKLYLTLAEYNYLEDWSFEDASACWEITDLKHADELYIEEKKSDSHTGTKHLHFWSSAKNSVEFTVEQKVNDLPAGWYRYSISIMGGDCGNTEIYAYVKINGETAAVCPMHVTVYNEWFTGEIPLFEAEEGDEITVGAYVCCEGSGNGAWGKLDDAYLNRIS